MKKVNLIPITGDIFTHGLNNQLLIVFGDRTLNCFRTYINKFMETNGIELKIDQNNKLGRKIGEIESIFWSSSNLGLEYYLHVLYQLILRSNVKNIGVLVPKLTKNLTDQIRVNTLDNITILKTIICVQNLTSAYPEIPLENIRLYSLSESLQRVIPETLEIKKIDLNYDHKSLLMSVGCYLLSERKVIPTFIQRIYNLEYKVIISLLDELASYGVIHEEYSENKSVLVSDVFELKDKLKSLYD